MKSMLMAIMAVAVAVTFSAPAFAGEKKEEKKGGHVVISAEEFRRLAGKKPSFKEFLLSGPYFDDLEIERSTEPTRIVEL